MNRLHAQKRKEKPGASLHRLLPDLHKFRNSPLRVFPPHCPPCTEASVHCDSELHWHDSCISWHKRSRARWQLRATRASSQSSRKRETMSPDQFCPITSRARLSTLWSTSKEDVPSVPVQSPTSLIHVSQINRKAAVRQRGISSAILCKPHKVYALIVSTVMECPKSTISLSTTGSFFFKKKKKSLLYGPCLCGTFQMLAVVRNPTTSHGSTSLPNNALSTHQQHRLPSWMTYSVLPNKRPGGKESDRRRVWHFMERWASSASTSRP